ncbi:MAG TPA: DUF402 domain-containing protein [Ktedonobacteraceae bacterium]|nr:DUF402 domain-containing protein [Ktedonobacteraceae bacterium]
MITVVKQNPLGEAKIQYQGEVLKRLPGGVIIQAYWTHAAKDLGYTRFEPGDRFIEYYYSQRWFNIFDIANAAGERKGWYCNITQPAVFFDDRIEQVDLLLDVWVTPKGAILTLDEDEFASAATLTAEQRNGARQGLQDLLTMIAARQETFSNIEERINRVC